MPILEGSTRPSAPAASPPSGDQDAVTVVLRAAAFSGSAAAFLARRARSAVDALPTGAGRRHLSAVLRAATSPGAPDARVTEDDAVSSLARSCALVGLAGHLESRGLMTEAAAALDLATAPRQDDPELLLHRARVARKSGDVDGAGALYDRIMRLDSGGCLSCMALVGRALLASEPERALGRAIRVAVTLGEAEAAAVAQEARARVRRARGDIDGALRDYAVAAARYDHAADRGRIGHEAADLLLSVGDALAARRVLLEVERSALPVQAAWARSRLLHVSRALSDDLGRRRWADAGAPSLVSLSPRARPGVVATSRAERVGRLIDRLGGA